MIEKERERKSVEPGKEYVEARSWGLTSSMSCRSECPLWGNRRNTNGGRELKLTGTASLNPKQGANSASFEATG
jgi:hypothetical protein